MSSISDSPDTWLRNFRLHVDGDRVDWQTYKLNLVSGAVIVLTLEYKHSALIGTPQGVIAIHYRPIGLTGVEISPPPGQLIEMVEGSESLSWTIRITKADIDGFEIYLTLPNYPPALDSPPIPVRIFASPWSKDFTFFVDDDEVDLANIKLNLFDGQVSKLTVEYAGSELIDLPESYIGLTLASGEGVENLTVSPKLGELVHLDGEVTSKTWFVSAGRETPNLDFLLQFEMPKLAGVPASLPFSVCILNELWQREFVVFENESEVDWGDLRLYVYDAERFSLALKCDRFPLAGLSEHHIVLKNMSGWDLSDLNIDPRLGLPAPIEPGNKSVSWAMSTTPRMRDVPLTLQFVLPDLKRAPGSPLMYGRVFRFPWETGFSVTVDHVLFPFRDVQIFLVEASTCIITLDYGSSDMKLLPDTDIAMVYQSGYEAKGLDFNPPLGEPCPMEVGGKTLQWIITRTPEAQNSRFLLRFVMPRFPGMRPSAPMHGFLFNDVWHKEFTVRINGKSVNWADLWFSIFDEGTCTLTLDYDTSSLPGPPIGVVSLRFMAGTEVDGVLCEPPFGQPIIMASGSKSLSWTLSVTNNARNKPIQLEWCLPNLYSASASPLIRGQILNDFWKRNIIVRVDGVRKNWSELNLALEFGKTCILELEILTGSFLNLPKASLTLLFQDDEVEGLDVKPPMGEPVLVRPETTSLSWRITPKRDAGDRPFILKFEVSELPDLPASPPISGDISNDLWGREFTPFVNDVRFRWEEVEVYLAEGQECVVTLNYRGSWLPGTDNGLISLGVKGGEQILGLRSVPKFGEPIVMEPGTESLSWTIIADAGFEYGSTVLQFGLAPSARLSPTPSPPVLTHVICFADELSADVDGFSMGLTNNFFPCIAKSHDVHLSLTRNSRLLDKHIRVDWIGDPALSLGIEPLPEGARQIDERGLTYTLDGTSGRKFGYFVLKFWVVEWNLLAMTINMDLAHNKVRLGREWFELGWAYARYDSVFTNAPASRVAVLIKSTQFPDGIIEVTSDEGEVRGAEDGLTPVTFSVTNRYDNSEA